MRMSPFFGSLALLIFLAGSAHASVTKCEYMGDKNGENRFDFYVNGARNNIVLADPAAKESQPYVFVHFKEDEINPSDEAGHVQAKVKVESLTDRARLRAKIFGHDLIEYKELHVEIDHATGLPIAMHGDAYDGILWHDAEGKLENCSVVSDKADEDLAGERFHDYVNSLR